MSQESGGTDPLIHGLGNRYLPIEDLSFWHEFQKRWPVAAVTVWDSAYAAVSALIDRTKK